MKQNRRRDTWQEMPVVKPEDTVTVKLDGEEVYLQNFVTLEFYYQNGYIKLKPGKEIFIFLTRKKP